MLTNKNVSELGSLIVGLRERERERDGKTGQDDDDYSKMNTTAAFRMTRSSGRFVAIVRSGWYGYGRTTRESAMEQIGNACRSRGRRGKKGGGTCHVDDCAEEGVGVDSR